MGYHIHTLNHDVASLLNVTSGRRSSWIDGLFYSFFEFWSSGEFFLGTGFLELDSVSFLFFVGLSSSEICLLLNMNFWRFTIMNLVLFVPLREVEHSFICVKISCRVNHDDRVGQRSVPTRITYCQCKSINENVQEQWGEHVLQQSLDLLICPFESSKN